MAKFLTSRSDYGLLLVTFLADQPREESFSIAEVSSHFNLPQAFLEQIARDLKRAHILISRRGRDGGYRLVRNPERVSVVEVIEALEGPLQAVSCQTDDCPAVAACFTRSFWLVFQKHLHRTLREVTVADLLAKSPHKLLPLTRSRDD